MYCEKCGQGNDDNAFRCVKCGEIVQILPVAQAVPQIEDTAGMRMLLPVGRSMWAIAAGYVALFSVLILPAPLALALGITAVVHIRRNPGLHGMGRAVFAIVMGALFSMLLIMCVIGILTG